MNANVEEFLTNVNTFRQIAQKELTDSFEPLKAQALKLKAVFPDFIPPWELSAPKDRVREGGPIQRVFEILPIDQNQRIGVREIVDKLYPEDPNKYSAVTSQVSKYCNEEIIVGGFKIVKFKADGETHFRYYKVPA